MIAIKTDYDMHQCIFLLMKADNPGKSPFAIFISPGMYKFSDRGMIVWRFLVIDKIMLSHFNCAVAGNSIYFNAALYQYTGNFTTYISFGSSHDAVFVRH